MFFTYKLKWWKVLCFFLVVLIVCMGLYYMRQTKQAVPSTVYPQEGQIWQV